MTLVCPLCCNETFESHVALKNHISEIQENLKCPECNVKFHELSGLTKHLEQECSLNKLTLESHSKAQTQPMVPDDNGLNGMLTTDEHGEMPSETEEDQGIPQQVQNPFEELEGDEPRLVESGNYYCKLCCMHFEDINAHLEEYHKGEEVIVEEENDESNATNKDAKNTPENMYLLQHADASYVVHPSFRNAKEEEEEEEEQPTIVFSDVSFKTPPITKLDTLTQQECKDKDGRLYTRKFVKIDRFWLKKNAKKPIIQNFSLPNGTFECVAGEKSQENEDDVSVMEIHQCPHCAMLFMLIEDYKKHKCSGRQRRFDCTVCSASYTSADELKDHSASHSEEITVIFGENVNDIERNAALGPFVCEVCNTTFTKMKSLRLHSRMHDPIKVRDTQLLMADGFSKANKQMFVCQICDRTYDKEYEQIHMSSHVPTSNSYNCEMCNRKFFTRSNLEMHVKGHSNNKKFACDYCKKPFITLEALNDHLTNQCQKRMYACQFCGRRFGRPHEKVKHERIHTGEKPHVCDICGKAFRVSYCLTLHLRTHSGLRPYECAHCGRRFKSHSVYNHHLHTHSDVRAYKCPYCPKAFKTSVQLAGHKNSHTKPFACTECNRPFASLYSVRAHMETHKRENSLKYECGTCGALYSRGFALRDHIKQQHQTSSERGEDMLSLDTGNAQDNEGEENLRYECWMCGSIYLTASALRHHQKQDHQSAVAERNEDVEEIDGTNSMLGKEDEMILGLEDSEHIAIIENEEQL